MLLQPSPSSQVHLQGIRHHFSGAINLAVRWVLWYMCMCFVFLCRHGGRGKMLTLCEYLTFSDCGNTEQSVFPDMN